LTWVFVNFPYDAHVATMRFKVNDATIHKCNDEDLRAHTIKEMSQVHGYNEAEYLQALAPVGWTVGSLSQWRASTAKATSMYASKYDPQYCTIQIPLTRNPTSYILKYYVFDVMFLLAGVTSAHFEKPTQVTSRYSINILCMLLLMTTLRRDLGYGVVEYVTIVNLQADVSMVVLTFSLCLTITVQKLGDTQLGSIVNKVGQKTLLVASITCAVGFLIQLASLQPSPSSASPVYTELQTAAIVSHLWPWLVMGLVWVVASVVYIYKAYRSRLMLVRKTVKILQEIDPSADEHTFEQDSAEAFLLLDVGKRGVVSSQELRPFLERIAEAEGRMHESAFTELFRQSRAFTGLCWKGRRAKTVASKWAHDDRILVENPQGIKLEDFQKLVKTRIAGTKTAALEGSRRKSHAMKVAPA